MGFIEKLILFSIGMLTLPVGGFFVSKSFLFEGENIIGLALKLSILAYRMTKID